MEIYDASGIWSTVYLSNESQSEVERAHIVSAY